MSIIPTQTVGAIDKTKRVAHWLDVQSGAQPGSFYFPVEAKENLRQALREVSNSARRELGKHTFHLSPVRSSGLRGLYSSGVGEGELGFSSINGVHVVVCGEDDSERRRVPSVQVRGLGNLYTQFGMTSSSP